VDKAEYELVREVQDTHWWWLGRKRIIETLIEKNIKHSKKLSIADIGCGFGGNISMLRQYGDVTALELNKEAISQITYKWGDSVKTIVWKSPEAIAEKFDLMLLADVLEHIPNNIEAIEWIYEHLNDGGYCILTVPAHMFFWSDMDDVVHHYQRYGRNNFLSPFVNKFHIVYFSFYNMILFPVKVAFVFINKAIRLIFPKRKKRSYNDVPPRIINSLFKRTLYIEAWMVKYGISLPFGVSMVLLVKKGRVGQ